nr:HAMP domain-containing protein [Corallococcus exiguus]
MTLRSRLLLAQAPLVLALLFLGATAVITLARVGRSGQQVLEDNYRSVLATQRITEQLERMDSAALFIIAGERERGLTQQATQRPSLETELGIQQGNITEPGEAEATQRLRTAWTKYREEFDVFLQARDTEAARTSYFESLSPAFQEAKAAASAVLALNQDAMVRKNDRLRQQSEQVNTLMVLAVVVALGFGLFFTTSLVQRALRPVSVLSQAVRRLGQGDVEARAVVEGRDEIAGLARDFNTMAERLAQYRKSSLGELLQAQAVSQAAIDSLPDPVLVLGAEGGLLNVNAAAEDVLRLRLDEGGDALGRVEPEVRAVLERVRAHVVGGRGAYQPGATKRRCEWSHLQRASAGSCHEAARCTERPGKWWAPRSSSRT